MGRSMSYKMAKALGIVGGKIHASPSQLQAKRVQIKKCGDSLNIFREWSVDGIFLPEDVVCRIQEYVLCRILQNVLNSEISASPAQLRDNNPNWPELGGIYQVYKEDPYGLSLYYLGGLPLKVGTGYGANSIWRRTGGTAIGCDLNAAYKYQRDAHAMVRKWHCIPDYLPKYDQDWRDPRGEIINDPDYPWSKCEHLQKPDSYHRYVRYLMDEEQRIIEEGL